MICNSNYVEAMRRGFGSLDCKFLLFKARTWSLTCKLVISKQRELYKRKRSKARALYYANGTATFQVLLLCGDISTNPGPVNVKCDNCMKTIRKNQKSVTCEICFGQRHLNCTELNIKCLTSTWTCPKCLFTGVDNSLSVSYVGISESVVNILKEHKYLEYGVLFQQVSGPLVSVSDGCCHHE